MRMCGAAGGVLSCTRRARPGPGYGGTQTARGPPQAHCGRLPLRDAPHGLDQPETRPGGGLSRPKLGPQPPSSRARAEANRTPSPWRLTRRGWARVRVWECGRWRQVPAGWGGWAVRSGKLRPTTAGPTSARLELGERDGRCAGFRQSGEVAGRTVHFRPLPTRQRPHGGLTPQDWSMDSTAMRGS